MPDFLVETYQPPGTQAVPPSDAAVRHLRSIEVPGDHMSLHLFSAATRESVRAALEQAAFAYERIVEAAMVTPDRQEERRW